MTPDAALSALLARLPWPRIRPEAAAASGRPRHQYPWTGLEAEIAAGGGRELPVLGYGSLMNPASALRTVADPAARRDPVVGFRVRRVFDYRMPPSVLSRYPPPPGPDAVAALNAYPSDADEDVVTGVVCGVPLDALPAFREREAGYDLVPVVVLPYPDLARPPAAAFYLSCPPVPADGVRRTDPALAPHPAYADVCLDGARAVSEEFAALFLATCYLGDRTTRYAPPGGARPGG